MIDETIINPEGMLKKNHITGTTDPVNFSQSTQKYDLEKNIILKRNPLILTEKNVTNKIEFNKVTQEALVEVLNKKKALMNSIWAQN